VLDRIHSGGERIGDPLRAVRMRRDPEPVSVCLNGRSELRAVVLRLVRSERRCHISTGCHDLNDVDAAGHPIADRSANAVLAVGHTTKEPAVAARDGEGRPGGENARADLVAVAEHVSQCQGQVVAVPKIADRGDSHGERLLRGTVHPLQHRGVILSLEMGHWVVRGVEHQMLVGVDEAWEQRDVAKINDITGIRP
jgi:hypothetical protein